MLRYAIICVSKTSLYVLNKNGNSEKNKNESSNICHANGIVTIWEVCVFFQRNESRVEDLDPNFDGRVALSEVNKCVQATRAICAAARGV